MLGYKHISSLYDDITTEKPLCQERVGLGILAENTKRPKDDTYAVKSGKSLTWAEVVKCKM